MTHSTPTRPPTLDPHEEGGHRVTACDTEAPPPYGHMVLTKGTAHVGAGLQSEELLSTLWPNDSWQNTKKIDQIEFNQTLPISIMFFLR